MPYLTLAETETKVYRLRRSLDAYLKGHRLSDNEMECSERSADIEQLLNSIKTKLFFNEGDIIRREIEVFKVVEIKEIGIDQEDDSINVTLELLSIEPIEGIKSNYTVGLNRLKDQKLWQIVDPENYD